MRVTEIHTTSLIRSTPWYTRWWTRLSGTVSKVLGTLNLGADWAPGNVSRPEYDVQNSMSAMAAFPWVYAALMRASADLSGLPLRLYRRRRNGVNEEITDRTNAVLRLLRIPNPAFTGRQLRRQLYVDLRLAGNGFVAHVGDGAASMLQRLHPRRVELEPDTTLGIGQYVYTGNGERQFLNPDDVYHVRTPSWRDDPRALFGTGCIEPLHDDLTTDRRAAKAAATMAKRPRPDIVVSSNEEGDLLSEPVREAIAKKLDRLLGEGGTVVLPSRLKLDLPSWAPKDMEFPALRQLVREAVLAVTNIPPHVLGLPVANYAQAKEQTLTYWEFQQSVAADMEDAFYNPLAESFDADYFLTHDFSKVDALQDARNSRLQRVQTWWTMGFDPVAMAKYEGFTDLPDNAFAPEAGPVPDPAPVKAALLPWVKKAMPPEDEDARKALWEAFIKGVHAPSEKKWAGAMSLFLRQQAERVSKRAEGLQLNALKRDLVDDILAVLWDAIEDIFLKASAGKPTKDTLKLAWKDIVSQIGTSLTWEPSRIDPVVNQQLARLVSQVNSTTKDTIRQIVLDAIANGETIAQMQARIQQAAAFAPARALAIARTETTRSTIAGSQVAYQQALAAGVSVKKQWLAQWNARDAHAELDGQIREVGEDFIIPTGDYAGRHAHGPGEFGVGALDINCRCTTIAVVEED